MATNTEQRQLEIILNAQQANASIKEMGAGVALLKNQLEKMADDDPRRAQLQRDFQQLSQRVAEARAENRTYQKSVEELAEEERKLNEENKQVILNGQKVSASFNDMDRAAKQLETQLKDLSADDPGRQKLLTDYQQMQQRLAGVKQELGETATKSLTLKDALAFAGVQVGVEAIVEGLGNIGREIFETTAKFETYGAVLKTALGSESAAQKALADIQNMAAKTPFSVDELTSSFIKFVNRGLNPSMAEMSKLADIAASQGKSFDQLTEAVLDAGTGEFERLKEFGIQASKSGDQVTLAFKGTQQVVANTPEAIQAALLSFGELEGVMGSTAAISETLEGQVSNLGDTADQLKVQIGQGLRPVFVAVLSTLGFLLNVLKELPGFISENRGVLLALGGAVLTFNAGMIQSNALLLANAVASKAKVIWDGAVAASTKAWEVAQRGLNLALAANPIGAVIAVGTLLVGLFVALYDKSEKVRATVAGLGAGFMALVKTIKDGVVQNLAGVADVLTGIFTLNPDKIKAGLTNMGASLKTIYYDSGKNAAEAYSKGYDERLASERATKAGKQEDTAAAAAAARKQAEAAAKAKAAADAAAHLQGLKEEEFRLKERIAQATDGTLAEIRLKQQLVRVHAQVEMADEKKSAAEKRMIRAEALAEEQQLEKTFLEKREKDREESRKREEALRKKADQEHLNELKQMTTQIGGTLQSRDALADQLERSAMSDATKRREQERQKIFADADAKVEKLTGMELDYNEQVKAIVEERGLALRELAAKFEEEDEKKRQEQLDKQIAQAEADEEVALAALEVKLANGVINEQAYQDAVYAVKLAAVDRELELLKQKSGVESDEYKKALANKLTLEADYITKSKKAKDDLAKFEMLVGAAKKLLTNEEVAFLGEAFGKKSGIYKAAIAAQKAVAIAEIGISLSKQFMANAEAGAKISALFPGAVALGAAYTIGANVASTVSAGVATAKVLGFRTGGATGAAGMGKEVGLQVGGNGKLVDSDGFAVAGVVHENEYVIPAWLRQDPQVIQMEQYLEARRVRGYLGGGPTSGDVVPTAPGTVAGGEGQLVQLLTDLLTEQRRQNEQMTTWVRELQVVQNLYEFDKDYDTYKKVNNQSGIR